MTKEIPGNPTDFKFSSRIHNADTVTYRQKFKEGHIDVYNIIPRNAGPIPVLLAQGFAVNDPRYPKMDTLVEAGFEVVAVHPRPHGGRMQRGEYSYGIETERKAKLYSGVMQGKGIDRSHIIAVSGGADPALVYAIQNPEKVSSMVLVNAGLNGEATKMKLTKGFIDEKTNKDGVLSRNSPVGKATLQAYAEFAGHVSNPKRAMHEIEEMGRIDTYLLCVLAARMGVDISVIMAEKDMLFPLEESLSHFKNSRDEYGSVYPSPFSEVHIITGGHDELYPDNPVRIRLAAEILKRRQAEVKKRILLAQR